jgi:hypothetical protein
MSRPRKIHPPLPFTFNEVLKAVAAGRGVKKKGKTKHKPAKGTKKVI